MLYNRTKGKIKGSHSSLEADLIWTGIGTCVPEADTAVKMTANDVIVVDSYQVKTDGPSKDGFDACNISSINWSIEWLIRTSFAAQVPDLDGSIVTTWGDSSTLSHELGCENLAAMSSEGVLVEGKDTPITWVLSEEHRPQQKGLIHAHIQDNRYTVSWSIGAHNCSMIPSSVRSEEDFTLKWLWIYDHIHSRERNCEWMHSFAHQRIVKIKTGFGSSHITKKAGSQLATLW